MSLALSRRLLCSFTSGQITTAPFGIFSFAKSCSSSRKGRSTRSHSTRNFRFLKQSSMRRSWLSHSRTRASCRRLLLSARAASSSRPSHLQLRSRYPGSRESTPMAGTSRPWPVSPHTQNCIRNDSSLTTLRHLSACSIFPLRFGMLSTAIYWSFKSRSS